MPTPYDILGVISLVISIIISFPLVRWIKNKLPHNRLRFLDEIFNETDSLLLSLEEDGVFSKPGTVKYYRESLRRVREDAKQSRWSTYQATTSMSQLHGIFSGLSKKLANLCDEALELRAEISTTATDERRQMLAQSSNCAAPTVGPPVSRQPIARCPIDTVSCSDRHAKVVAESAPAASAWLPRALLDIWHDYLASTTNKHNFLRAGLEKGPVLPVANPNSTTTSGSSSMSDIAPMQKKHLSQQFLRRSKRFRTMRSYFSPSIAQMEYTKPGVLRNEEYRRVLRSRTSDSFASTDTCVSASLESNDLQPS